MSMALPELPDLRRSVDNQPFDHFLGILYRLK